ncbi:MAG: hypothetical protein PHE77_01915 [Candidatus Pacebacteria bacterium]|nr:hypothetical protein [Candidatus Paceibacterota bacterium]
MMKEIDALIEALSSLSSSEPKCEQKSIDIFKTLVLLSDGLTKNVAMLVPIRVGFDAHDFLSHCQKVNAALAALSKKFIFYHHGVISEHFAVMGFGTKIYQHVKDIENIVIKNFDISIRNRAEINFDSLPYKIFILSGA